MAAGIFIHKISQSEDDQSMAGQNNGITESFIVTLNCLKETHLEPLYFPLYAID